MKKYLPFLLLTLMGASLWWSCGNSGQPAEESPFDQVKTSLPEVRDSFVRRTAGFSEDYENTDRLIWQKPNLVIDLLGDIDDKTIADIGAGTGFFSLRLSQKAQKVIAIDIDSDYIDYLDSVKLMEVPTQYQDRLEPRLGRADDPLLEPNEADIAMIVNTYMYIKDRVKYMRDLHADLPPGGVVLIIDFKKKRTPLGPPQEIRLPLYQAENELFEAGFSKVSTNDNSLDYQYIILAEK